MRGQTGLRLLVGHRGSSTHQLPEDDSSMSSPSDLLTRPERTQSASPLKQHESGFLHKSPMRAHLETPLRDGSSQSAVAEGNTCAQRIEPRSRHVVSDQCPLRGVDTTPTNGSDNQGDLWQGRGQSLYLKRQLSLPNLLFEVRAQVVSRLAQAPPVCFSPGCPDPPGNQASQGQQAQSPPSGPDLDESALVLGAVAAVDSSPMAHSSETGPSLSGKQNDLAPTTRVVGSAPLDSRRDSSILPDSVLNTISQARAPSTRRLYALKWSIFSAWCATNVTGRSHFL